jgi:branched-subunit amino acid aminotransferase/4-amino-4-deoxychorismate lyase
VKTLRSGDSQFVLVTRGGDPKRHFWVGCLPGTARERVAVWRMLGVDAEEAVLNQDDLEFADGFS